MTRIVLIRHGEAECNVARRFGGPAGCSGLSDRGRSQVERLRDRLVATGELAGASVLVASTLPRAIQTAEIVNDALGALTIELDARVSELHPGEADGMTYADYGRTLLADHAGRWADDPTVPAAPGGESWRGFLDRVHEALADLVRDHRDETIVVACHGGVVEASMLELLGVGGPYRLGRFSAANASLTEWRVVRQEWRLVRYNDAAHLDAGR